MRRTLLLALVALAGSGTAPAEDAAPPAEEAAPTPPRWVYEAAASAGYRFVDVSGSEARYRTDVDLREGGRLFLLQYDGTSQQPDETPVDRIHLQVDTPGDEPASYYSLRASNRRQWDFRADFTRSRWIYDIPQLWERPVAGNRSIEDLHTWDFIRTQGVVDFAYHPKDRFTLRGGYRLYERDGTSTSTVFEPAGNTFVLGAPVDSVAHVGVFGTDFTVLSTDVSFTQEYRWIARRFDADGPTRFGTAGLDPASGVDMADYDRRRSDQIDMPVTIVRLRRPIGETAEITGAYLYSHASLDASGVRTASLTGGSAPYTGTQQLFSNGNGSLDTHVADLAGSWQVAPKVTLNLSYRFNERSQDTDLTQSGTQGPLLLDTGYQVRWNSVTGDVQYEPRRGLSLRAGLRYAHRDASFSTSGQSVGTDYVGMIADARWRPVTWLDLNARYENVRLDDPLTTAGDPLASPAIPAREIVLTYTNRGTAGFRLTPLPWLSLQYQLIAESRQNDTFAGSASSFGNSVGCSLSPLDGLTLFAGYQRRDIDASASIRAAPIYDRTLSVQAGSEDAVTSTMRYEFPLLGYRWAAGWNFSWVLVDEHYGPRLEPGGGQRTAYDLDRIDGGAFFAFLHPWIEPSVEVRRIHYAEQVLSLNDYDATIVALKLTKRLGNAAP